MFKGGRHFGAPACIRSTAFPNSDQIKACTLRNSENEKYLI